MATSNETPVPQPSPSRDGPGGPTDPPTVATGAPWPDGPDQPWPTIPGYQVLDVLGMGGFAIVYRVRHLGSGRQAALKILRGMVTTEHPTGGTYLEHEARLLRRFQHPHIVRLLEAGQSQGRSYLVLEWAEGGDLQQRLRDGPLAAREVVGLMLPVARALQALHSESVIHRNLKPANILLTSSGEPRLADFELALALRDEKVERDVGGTCGTPAYMAPEQVRGDRLGPATDVYGLGATLYALLTGRPPYADLPFGELFQQILGPEPPLPPSLSTAVPADLEAVVVKCLQKDPAMRYHTAGAVADDLHRCRLGQPVEARPLGAVGRALRWLNGGTG